MPYNSTADLPESTSGLADKKKRQWMHVFNSCYKKHGDDEKCHKMAWGVTGGWKENKGLKIKGPGDPDRDISIELEVDSIMGDEEYISKSTGLSVEINRNLEEERKKLYT